MGYFRPDTVHGSACGRSQGAGNQTLLPCAGQRSGPVLSGKHKPQAQKKKEKERGKGWHSRPAQRSESKVTEQKLPGLDMCMGVSPAW